MIIKMNTTLRIFVFTVAVAVFTVVFVSLVRRKINESSSILWLSVGVLALAVGIFPDSVDYVARWMGVTYEPSLVFMTAIALLLLIVFRNNCHIATLELKVRELAMQLSIIKSEHSCSDAHAGECAAAPEESVGRE